MSTIVIRKVGFRRIRLTHYAPALAPAALIEVRSKEQAVKMAEWCVLRLRQCASDVANPALPFLTA